MKTAGVVACTSVTKSSGHVRAKKMGFVITHPLPSRQSTMGLTGGLDRSRRDGRDRGHILCRGLLNADFRRVFSGATARHERTEGAGCGIRRHARAEPVDEANGWAYGEGIRQLSRRERGHRRRAIP